VLADRRCVVPWWRWALPEDVDEEAAVAVVASPDRPAMRPVPPLADVDPAAAPVEL